MMNKQELTAKMEEIKRIDPTVWMPAGQKLVCLVLDLAEEIKTMLPEGKLNQGNIPEGFMKLSAFAKKYNLASAAWLASTINPMLVSESYHMCIKAKGTWYVHPENLIEFFAANRNMYIYPIMHRRCKRYLENLQNSYPN